MRRILSIAGLGIFLIVGVIAAAEDFTGVQYRYGGERLFLTFPQQMRGDMVVQFVPFDNLGRSAGKKRRERFTLTEEQQPLVLSMPNGVAHQLVLETSGKTLHLFANRGTWYLGANSQHHALTQIGAQLASADFGDRIIATGVTVNVGRMTQETPLTVGRTFGPDDGFGARLAKKERSLVVVASAEGKTQGGVISVAERLGAEEIRYYDYPIMLDTVLRRYEIPFVKFLSRDGDGAILPKTIHAVSFRTTRNVTAGDKLRIDHLGLTTAGPRIDKIVRSKRGASAVLLRNVPRGRAVTLHAQNAAGEIRSSAVHGKRISLSDDTESVWLCAETSDSVVCDPPDAPRTTYAAHADASKPMVLDSFDTPLPINRFRRFATVFAATTGLETNLTEERLDGGIRVTYYPETAADYAGYLTTVPAEAAVPYQTLVVTLRGSIPPNYLYAGLKDQKGREARIPFISYWSGEDTAANPLFDLKYMNQAQDVDGEGFRSVRFPIDAFRAVFHNVFEGHAVLTDIFGVSITMTYGGSDIFHEIELRRIEVTNEQVPIVITAFDNERYGINSLGGVNFSEDKNGAELDVRLNSDGFYGKGLRVEVSLPGSDAYGLVAFGFGKLDVEAYSHLSFSVRGERGQEDAAVYLNDGKCRGKVLITDIHQVGRMWQKVRIPLERFQTQGVDLSHLTQLILAWEGAYLSKRILYFDNFLIE